MRPQAEPSDEQVAGWLRGYAEHRDPAGRQRVILAHLDLADRLAARYQGRPHTTPDDLRQTARVALIGAVDRYDPAHGTPFRPYAIASICGELKRHLRDATWPVRLARTIKQHALELHGDPAVLLSGPEAAGDRVVLGCSHMQVSRLLHRALQRLRAQLVGGET